MGTLSTLGAVQLDHVQAFPPNYADNPLRAITLEELQRRNTVLDAVFYDVKVVTPEEAPHLEFWLAREGAIVFVPPSGQGALRVYPNAEEFLGSGERASALAVAGVGSSALGAAAFARNVADAINAPVAAVVSGYGLADVLTEALGGFFWFGGLNSLRHLFEPLDTLSKGLSRSEQSLEASEGLSWVRASRDTETVVTLLKDPRFAPGLLVGHSKGNLVLSEALYSIASESKSRAAGIAERCRIVTVSAKIGMPVQFHDVIYVMGEWDWFGAVNSRPDIPTDLVVPRAWHSTNTEFPLHMGIDVVRTVKDALARPSGQSRTCRGAQAAALFDLPQRLTAAFRGAPFPATSFQWRAAKRR